MCTPREEREAALFRAAAAWLSAVDHGEGFPFRLNLSYDGYEHTLRCRSRPAAEERPVVPTNGDGRPGVWLSPLEAQIVAAATTTWQSGAKIAEKVGEEYSEAFRCLCSNLVERGIFDSAPGKGYRLAR